MSSICGGVISESRERRDMKKYGVWANVMGYVMPDREYKKYVVARKTGKEKEATKLFERYVRSSI